VPGGFLELSIGLCTTMSTIIISVIITAILVGPVCWLGGANNARRTKAVSQSLKDAAKQTRE
jgi:hypothetical protein